MKKIITVLIGVLLAGSLSAQTKNWWRYITYCHGGLKIGNTILNTGVNKPGSLLIKIDSATTDNITTPTLIKFYSGTTQLAINKIASPFTLGSTSVTTSAAQFNFLNTAASNIQTQLNLKADTTGMIQAKTLYPQFTDSTYSYSYGLCGTGVIGDTALFQNNGLVGWFHNDRDTLAPTDLWGVLTSGAGTETLTIQVSWDVNWLDGSPTVLNTSAFTINDIEGAPGDHDVSFNNSKIPPNRWVWFTIAGLTAGNKPIGLAGSLYFYRIPSH